MSKSEYLSGVVNEFAGWLASNLDSAEFKHTWRNRRTDKWWACASIFDAYCQYQWPHRGVPYLKVPGGVDYASNVEALEAMRVELLQALADGDDRRTRDAAVAVMEWGGVTRGNVSWLTAHQDGLANMLGEVRGAFNAGDLTDARLKATDLRFNAGMTKVYALISDNFIIYDSRVAAALGWMVARFQGKTGADVAQLKDLLFALPAHKESATAADPKRRNPSHGAMCFPLLAAGPAYAAWNLKANWLLEAVLDHSDAGSSGFASLGERRLQLRALEAALFMIGYDLPTNEAAAPEVKADNDPIDWNECFTLSRRNPFFYRIKSGGIAAKGENGTSSAPFSDEVINRTLTNLREQTASTNGIFKLDNSRSTKADNKPQGGLGLAYSLAVSNPDRASESSRLAAILCDMSVLVQPPSGSEHGGDWKLQSEVPGLLTATGEFDIRARINAMSAD